MIPTEDNYIDWILAGIRDYFGKLGYRVKTYSIGQVKERQCPIDRILAVGNKMVGLQFKRPYISKQGQLRYHKTQHQNNLISKARWIFYCLPDFTDWKYQEVALFHCKFVPELPENGKNNEPKRYYRWGSFAKALLECHEGVEIKDDNIVEKIIEDMHRDPKDVYLSLNKKSEELYLIRRDLEAEIMDYEPA